jgi:hypothetical protein
MCMFEISVDLYVIITHSIVQLNLLGLVNAGDTKHVLKNYSHSNTRHIVIYNLKHLTSIKVIKMFHSVTRAWQSG